MPSTAANIFPSADDATDHHIRLETVLLVVQLKPELVERHIRPPLLPGAAITLLPSAEQAIVHAPLGAALVDQVAPELVETHSRPKTLTTKSLDPSAEEATERHCFGGTLFDIQVSPPSAEV